VLRHLTQATLSLAQTLKGLGFFMPPTKGLLRGLSAWKEAEVLHVLILLGPVYMARIRAQ